MEQVALENISVFKDSEVIRSSQHGFMKRKPCLTNLITFCNEVTTLVDEGTAVGFIYFDFSKAFDCSPTTSSQISWKRIG